MAELRKYTEENAETSGGERADECQSYEDALDWSRTWLL